MLIGAVLLQSGTIGIDSQIVAGVIQVIGAAVTMVLCASVGYLFTKVSNHGERIARTEFATEMFMQSGQFNARPVTLSHNPLTEDEYALLDRVTDKETGITATLGELKEAAKVAYRELTDETLSKADRAPYLPLLQTLDMRIAAMEFDLKRTTLSRWDRLKAGLR